MEVNENDPSTISVTWQMATDIAPCPHLANNFSFFLGCRASSFVFFLEHGPHWQISFPSNLPSKNRKALVHQERRISATLTLSITRPEKVRSNQKKESVKEYHEVGESDSALIVLQFRHVLSQHSHSYNDNARTTPTHSSRGVLIIYNTPIHYITMTTPEPRPYTERWRVVMH